MDAEPTGPGGGRPQEPGPRAFATGYKPGSGDMMVYGGGVLTLVGFAGSAVNANPAFLVLSLVGSLSALYFWPVLDTRRPQLAANVQGLFVARVGIIPWANVRTLTFEKHALRTMRLVTLVIEPSRPLAEAVTKADTVPLAERFAARNARVRGGRVRVPLHTLAMAPDEVEARLTALRAAAGR